jgi:hypothetical protein
LILPLLVTPAGNNDVIADPPLSIEPPEMLDTPAEFKAKPCVVAPNFQMQFLWKEDPFPFVFNLHRAAPVAAISSLQLSSQVCPLKADDGPGAFAPSAHR